MGSVTLSDVGEGDVVRARFDPPFFDPAVGTVVTARGKIRTAAGMKWLASEEHRSSWGMPHLFDLLPEPPGLTLELEETAGEVKERSHAKARGEIVYPFLPRTARDVERALVDLAEMVEFETDRTWGGRRDQLKHQFHDMADLVELAQSKREYLLARARVGRDFHPWRDHFETVIRIETVRPLPSDFEPSRERRRDRARRLEEAVQLFGEAERETRRIASALSALFRSRAEEGETAGTQPVTWDVRRPHPNAQSLLLRAQMGTMRGEVWVAPSKNGLWETGLSTLNNKKGDRAQARLLREGHFKAVVKDVDDVLQALGLSF